MMKNIIVFLVVVAVATVSLVSAFSSVNNRMPQRALTTMSSGSFARFLESNTFIFQLGDVKIFSDPVMSQLDFGIPLVYKGNKKFIDENFELEDAAQTSDMVMISQSFDDHAHVPTLKRLAKMRPDMPYLVPPSAKATLISCGIPENMITTLLPGQRHEISKGGTKVEILATNGALLGPPWAQKENGYIMRSPSKTFPSVYYEPHCMFDELELKRIGNVDYVICPVIAQNIGSYSLVAGGKKAINLAKVLGAKYFIPMMNGGLTQEGVLSSVVQKEGSIESFTEMVLSNMPTMKILDGSPGRIIELV
jgi:L-ascorbate metabolism protein UlaG (beta-lactamase superfamily)|mmetsp:Transcript_19467/g.18794  ORF Transcript_19467/g.18794 Transcript_19467/m.18794 type:complete len:307 (+) Transcript_19467:98-1018(+)